MNLWSGCVPLNGLTPTHTHSQLKDKERGGEIDRRHPPPPLRGGRGGGVAAAAVWVAGLLRKGSWRVASAASLLSLSDVAVTIGVFEPGGTGVDHNIVKAV